MKVLTAIALMCLGFGCHGEDFVHKDTQQLTAENFESTTEKGEHAN